MTHVLFFWVPANPSLLLPLAVTRNFILHFISNFSFQTTSESPGVKTEGPPRCSSFLGAGFPLPFFLTPIHIIFICSWRPLLHQPIQQFLKIFYTDSMCVWVLGGLWKLIYESTTFLFSCHLPLEWFVGPGLFFHWRRIRLSMEEVSISNWWSSTAQMT